MVCAACGSQQTPGAQFCRQCGQHLQPSGCGGSQSTMSFSSPTNYRSTAMPERRTRVMQNGQALGILWCIYGVYRLSFGFIAAFAIHQLARAGGSSGDFPPFVVGMLGGIAPYVAIGGIIMAAFSLLAGFGLLYRKPWARTLVIVLGVLALIKLPVGTALGIYTLWVMAPSAAASEWERLQQADPAW